MGLAKNEVYKYNLHRLFYLTNLVSFEWATYIIIYMHKHIAYHHKATMSPI